MNSKYGNNKKMLEFMERMFTEMAVYPHVLIRDYQLLGLEAEQVLLLLRILRPYYLHGRFSMKDVAVELELNEEEARIVVWPFIAKNLLEEDSKTHRLSCNGLIDVFYEQWLSEQRHQPAHSDQAAQPLGIDTALLHDLTHLYHAFEQELGKNLSPIQSEEIRSWLEQDQVPAELVEEALKRAVLQGKRTFAYIKSILTKWREAGYTTLGEVLANDLKPEPKSKSASRGRAASGVKKSQYNEIYDKY